MAIVDKLIQFMIGVTDMAKSKAFYADTLGFEVTIDHGQGPAHWVSMNFPGGGASVTLTTYLGGILQPGTQSFYISTSDVQQAFDTLTGKGITPTNPITDDLYGPGSGVKWFSIADPDGNNLMIVQA